MPKIINTTTGENYLKKYHTPSDVSYIKNTKLYEKYLGVDSNNSTYTLSGSYIPGSNMLLVFVNGQKVELVSSNPVDATQYVETSINSITFGAKPLDTDIIEFYVIGGNYNVVDSDLVNLVSSGAIPNMNFKNKIINGNFDIWQRGVSQTTNAYGSDDRWINFNSGSTKVHSKQDFTLGQTEVPGNPKFFSRTVVTSVAGAGNYAGKGQRIEYVSTLSGKTATLSFWAKADSNKNIAVEFYQDFGSGGTPSTDISILTTTFALTTSWQKFTITVNIPSVSGKILGSDNNDYLFLVFWFDAGSTFNDRTNSLGQQSGTFDITQVQLEEGSITTPFEDRPIQIELVLCQRYFEQSLDYRIALVNGNARHNQYIFCAYAATAGRVSGNFLTSKRTTNGTWNIRRTSDGTVDNQAALYIPDSWTSCTATTPTCSYSQCWRMSLTVASGLTGGFSYLCSVGWSYDCEL